VSSYEKYVDWLEEALDDYGAAVDLMRLGRYGKACFLAQQAAEKAVKALMIKRLGVHVTVHSVAELLRRLRPAVSVPDELVAVGEKLDRYYVPTRYPNAWPFGAPHKHYTEEDAREAVECAGRVLEFVKREIEQGR